MAATTFSYIHYTLLRWRTHFHVQTSASYLSGASNRLRLCEGGAYYLLAALANPIQSNLEKLHHHHHFLPHFKGTEITCLLLLSLHLKSASLLVAFSSSLRRFRLSKLDNEEDDVRPEQGSLLRIKRERDIKLDIGSVITFISHSL